MIGKYFDAKDTAGGHIVNFYFSAKHICKLGNTWVVRKNGNIIKRIIQCAYYIKKSTAMCMV